MNNLELLVGKLLPGDLVKAIYRDTYAPVGEWEVYTVQGRVRLSGNGLTVAGWNLLQLDGGTRLVSKLLYVELLERAT